MVSVILIILGVLFCIAAPFCVLYFVATKKGTSTGLLFFILLLFIGIFLIIAGDGKSPTKEDVLKGNAIYQETITIQGGDSIKTYDIVWRN